jgi:hypothetical protein
MKRCFRCEYDFQVELNDFQITSVEHDNVSGQRSIGEDAMD